MFTHDKMKVPLRNLPKDAKLGNDIAKVMCPNKFVKVQNLFQLFFPMPPYSLEIVMAVVLSRDKGRDVDGYIAVLI